MAEIPYPVSWGGALVYGDNDSLYAFCGGNKPYFYCYDIGLNRWTSAPNAPAPVYYGGALTSNWYVGADGMMKSATNIWALRGGNTQDFWCFDLRERTWKVFPPIPEPVSFGGALAYGSDEINTYWVYAIVGGGRRSFYKFGPVAPPGGWPLGVEPRALPKWYSLPILPYNAMDGASLAVEDATISGISDTVYCNPTGKNHSLYSVSTGSWNPGPILRDTIGRGSAMTSTRNAHYDHRLYFLQGNMTDKCYWRALGRDWTSRYLSPLPFDVWEGGAITIGPNPVETYRIFALVGGNRRHFVDHERPRGDLEGGGEASDINPVSLEFRISPNPLTYGTKVSFSLPKDEEINLNIYDAGGRKIKTLFSGKLPSGNHSLSWDRMDEEGKKASPGIYFLRLNTKESTVLRKVVVK